MKRISAALLLGLTLLAVSAGCSAKNKPADTSQSVSGSSEVQTESESEPQEALKSVPIEAEDILAAIGTEAPGAYKIRIKNSTGREISGVTVKLMDEAEYPENYLAEGDVYQIDEERYLYYLPPAEDPDQAEQQTEGERLLEPGYDVQITFADGTACALHGFPMEDMKEGELLFEDEVVFLSYVSESTHETVSTKEAELAVRAQEQAAQAEAAAEAEAARQAEAEAEAARQAEAQRQAEAEAEAQRQAEAAAEAQRRAEAEAEAQRQAEAEAEAQRQAEAEAEAQRQQEAENQQNQDTGSGGGDDEGCLDDGLFY